MKRDLDLVFKSILKIFRFYFFFFRIIVTEHVHADFNTIRGVPFSLIDTGKNYLKNQKIAFNFVEFLRK